MQDHEDRDDHPVCRAIDLCEELSFNLGSAILCIWPALPTKEELAGALQYLERERARARRVYDDARAFIAEGDERGAGPHEIDAVGAIQIGVPIIAKKLARVIAEHGETSPLLAKVLVSLADDTKGFREAEELVQAEIDRRAKPEAAAT